MRRKVTRQLVAPLLAIVLTFASKPSVQAQDWPQRPVRILVPYAAGGNSDGMARISAQHLSDAFKQPFIVENRVGANGAIAGEAVARAVPDGHTLLWGVQPAIVIAPAMNKVPFDPAKDFAPISVVGTNPFVLIVNKNVPAKSVAEFVAWVKAQPDKLSYAEGSAGSVTHLSMALFLKRAGPRHDQCQLSRQCAGADRRDRRPPADHVLQPVRRAAACGNRRDPHPRGIERPACRADSRTSRPSPSRLSRLQRRDLERPDGAGRHAEADRRPDRGGDRQAPCKEPKFVERLTSFGADPSGITPQQFARH